MNFFIKIAKKGGIFVHRPRLMTWRAGPGGADVASRPTWRGSTAPLRRGAGATWQDACGPRVMRGGHVYWI